MKIHNEVTVAARPDELFAFVSDVERVAPCLPGATIEGRDGEDYNGSMKVKVGPINATYKGKLRFLELDEDARRAVMKARADEVNGQGNAEASITTEIEGSGDQSVIRMDTDLQMRGRVAQFGRGAMEKISQRMFQEFANNIERQFAGGDGAPPAGPDADADRGDGRADERPAGPEPRAAEPATGGDDDGAALDAFGIFVRPVLEKAAPIAVPAVLGFFYGYLVGRLREIKKR
jgi:carbon monoxide dehydrogenase subunit G